MIPPEKQGENRRALVSPLSHIRDSAPLKEEPEKLSPSGNLPVRENVTNVTRGFPFVERKSARQGERGNTQNLFYERKH